MNRKFMILVLFLVTLITNSYANTMPTVEIKKQKLIIGYYGRPNTKSLGILGQSNIDELVAKMQKKKNYFEEELDNKVDVQMAFHIIYGLATPDPGKRNTYMLRMSKNSLMEYINRAKKENFKVYIDLQMGTNTPVEALTPILKYLKYDNVHLAIDPEFKIQNIEDTHLEDT